jgi:hypothetical protein
MMIPERIYGEFDYVPEELIPEAHLELSVNSIDLKTRWQRCGLLSDLVAGYISAAYPDENLGVHSPVFNSISTVFQELIENAAKFSRHREAVIRIRIKHYDRILKLEIQNDATPSVGQKFESHLKVLFTTPDLDALQVNILENQVDAKGQSGIGLLMLLKDYPLKLGVMFMRSAPEREIVTVRLYYRIEGM